MLPASGNSARTSINRCESRLRPLDGREGCEQSPVAGQRKEQVAGGTGQVGKARTTPGWSGGWGEPQRRGGPFGGARVGVDYIWKGRGGLGSFGGGRAHETKESRG